MANPALTEPGYQCIDVLNWLANGMSQGDIKTDFVEVTDKMIDACLAYAADKDPTEQHTRTL